MSVQVPELARCLTCGYLLRELDEPVCPECARRFDPEDPKTYNADPQKRKRRRLIMLAIILLLIGVGLTLWSHNFMTAQMTFTLQDSGHIITFKRWELQPPEWLPLSYPGFHWRSDTKGNAPPREGEPFSFHIKAKYLQGWSNTFDGKVIDVNGIIVHPDNANEIMKALLDPGNRGISIGPRVAGSVTKSPGSR